MNGKYTWTIGPDVDVPANTWTRAQWYNPIVNTDELQLEHGGPNQPEHATEWKYEKAGLWSLMVNFAWKPNQHTPLGPIRTHARIMSGRAPLYFAVASTSATIFDLRAGEQFWQQVCMQPGSLTPDIKLWLEVWASAPLTCAKDGMQAPSFMQAFLSDV